MLILDIQNKSFGRKQILENFKYTFNPRGLYIISGSSGVGKTTLLRIISGLDKDFRGSVTDGGIRNTSYHFQEYRLFPNLNALDNIIEISFKSKSRENEKKAYELLARLGFSSEEMKLFPSELSGGMKQRVAFARAILKDAPILLLDEPTKELDSTLVDEMCKIIGEEAKKRTVILVTHIDHFAKFPSYELIKL